MLVATVPPTVALNGPYKIGQSNAGSAPITGTCSEQTNDRDVVPDISGFDYNVSCTSGAFTTGPANFTGLADGTHTVTATQLDAAGNSTTASSTIDKNVTAPSITINTPDTINSSNENGYAVSGTCGVSGRTVTVQVSSVQGSNTCNGGIYVVTVSTAPLAQGAVSIIASITDAYGITGSATASTM